ncbi:MAG TPA: C4-type zinc ribbon domain-containing protein [Mycobacteriales bacterium]|nr:C4-type zinc ribbon domain-containing protein [Mycobacteriales bacterium]
MKADPKVQQRLLDLQSHDSALARLEHRRRTLPELAVITDADTRLAALRNDLVRAETEVSDLDRELRRLENDVEQVRTRSARDQQRMQSGAVVAKELESLQHEVDTLARRQSDLEDTELEVMERREDAEGRTSVVRAEVEKVTAARDDAEAARDAAFAEIDAEAAADTGARAATATELPADLIALYEKIRAVSGGVGAAALKHRRCEGCRLDLLGSELRAAQAAAPDEVLRCENCRRILVRTAESGL